MTGNLAVWKYVLRPTTTQTVEMPVPAKVLHVASQGDDVCLWALVSPEAPLRSCTFRVVGTGHPEVDQRDSYVGTAHLPESGLVFHVFEETA